MTVRVVGIGTSSRGDDAVGLVVARRLAQQPLPGVTVAALEGAPDRLLDLLEGADAAVVVDAVGAAGRPGTLYRFDAAAGPLPRAVFRAPASTHAFGLAETVELARTLRRLPARVVVLGVEGAAFDLGAGLSAEVAAAVPAAADAVLAELEALR